MSAGAPDPLVLPVQVPEGAATLALLERIAAAVEDTEVGQRMGRYTDAASQRQVRDRGGAPRRAA